jgi:transposase
VLRSARGTAGVALSRPRAGWSQGGAKLCGACPIPASTGKTSRHRLNRGGNRQANAALHRVVVVRMRRHGPTLGYVRRRTAEGKSKAEIIRCLKRYVAREIFGYLCRTFGAASPAPVAA